MAHAEGARSAARGRRFNDGKRCIFDLVRRRLFTAYSVKKLLANSGFTVGETQGSRPPIRDMIGSSGMLRAIDTVASRLARCWPRLEVRTAEPAKSVHPAA